MGLPSNFVTRADDYLERCDEEERRP